MFSNVGKSIVFFFFLNQRFITRSALAGRKSIVFLCHQTMRQNPKMLSEIEKIIIKDKKKDLQQIEDRPKCL